jgi:hypothetical protein
MIVQCTIFAVVEGEVGRSGQDADERANALSFFCSQLREEDHDAQG